MTKKHSSRFTASDSPPRYTTTGHTQLPGAARPWPPATIHWLWADVPRERLPQRGTTSASVPPATEPATMADVTLGNFIACRTPHSGMLAGHRSAFQVLMALGNKETVVPVEVDTGWLELPWVPVTYPRYAQWAALEGNSLNTSCIGQNDSD